MDTVGGSVLDFGKFHPLGDALVLVSQIILCDDLFFGSDEQFADFPGGRDGIGALIGEGQLDNLVLVFAQVDVSGRHELERIAAGHIGDGHRFPGITLVGRNFNADKLAEVLLIAGVVQGVAETEIQLVVPLEVHPGRNQPAFCLVALSRRADIGLRHGAVFRMGGIGAPDREVFREGSPADILHLESTQPLGEIHTQDRIPLDQRRIIGSGRFGSRLRHVVIDRGGRPGNGEGNCTRPFQAEVLLYRNLNGDIVGPRPYRRIHLDPSGIRRGNPGEVGCQEHASGIGSGRNGQSMGTLDTDRGSDRSVRLAAGCQSQHQHGDKENLAEFHIAFDYC